MNTKALLEPMGSWAWWRSWFLIFLGCSVMGAGFVLFVNPYKFVPGGVYGMGIVLHNIFPSVQVGTFGYMFDIPLMLISMLVFGGGFGTRPVLAALYTPGFMNVLTRLVYPNPEAVESLDPSLLLGGRLDLSNDLLLTCVIGAVVIGIGQGFQPVAGYNFGAGDKKRTRQAFWFSTLFGTVVCVAGAALIALMEWNNPASMGGLSVPGKLMAALFQSVSTRTAGMNTIDLAACGPITKLLMSALQFIGAAPGSTGGGVKVTTFAVIILTIRSVAQGRDDCVIAEHHIESKTVYRALTIIVLGALAAVGSAVVVFYNTSDAVSVIDAIFESCSAFGTVGLSVGVTAQLNRGAKILYMLVMFMGRVGPVSLAMSLTAKPDDNKRKIMPVGHINVG